jgi:hypothetical protein
MLLLPHVFTKSTKTKGVGRFHSIYHCHFAVVIEESNRQIRLIVQTKVQGRFHRYLNELLKIQIV